MSDCGLRKGPAESSRVTKSKRTRRPSRRGGQLTSVRPPQLTKQVSWWMICAGLAVVAVVPYLQTSRYGFVNFDDGTYVAENGPVQQGLSWSSLAWAFTTMIAGNW